METIGQLTGGVAHDFNNILTVIIGMNEVLASAVARQPQLAEVCKTIDEAAERGVQLTQRMLAFARKQPLESRVLDLNEIVPRMVAMLRQTLGEHIRIETALEPDLWRTRADPSRLEDAILNLAVNARDAMPKGGRLLLETANVHLDEQYALDNAEVTAGDYVAVYVADSGTGMTSEVIERAFEPFFTTKEVGRGTGLGLSMVYGFAKQSRGHLKIYSELGHGTTIKLYLPRAMDEGASTLPSAPAAPQARQGGREAILVVEDDAAVRAVAVATLESVGYRVQQAADGRLALEILRQAGRDRSPLHRSRHAERHQRPGPAAHGARAPPRSQGHLHVRLLRAVHQGPRGSGQGRAAASQALPPAEAHGHRPQRARSHGLRRASRRLTCPWRRARWRRCRCAIPRSARAPS